MNLSRHARIRFVVLCLAGLPAALAVMPSPRSGLPDFDRRASGAAPAVAAGPAHRAAVAKLKAKVPDARVELDDIVGSPRWVTAPHGFLTGRDGAGLGVSAAVARALPADDRDRGVKAFLNEHAALFGHNASALNDARITREYVTPHNGLRSVVWQQELDGLPVFEGLLISHTTKNGELVSVSSRFVGDPGPAADRGTPNRRQLRAGPAVSAAQAIAQAAAALGESLAPEQVSADEVPAAAGAEFQRFRATPALTGVTHARLVWVPMDRARLRLGWEVLLVSSARHELFRVLVDAATGEAILRRTLTTYANEATYRVFASDSPTPFSPGHPAPSSVQPPVVPRQLIVTNALNSVASPNGWINAGDNETRGNNVDAHLDATDDNEPDLPRPQGTPERVFDFPLNLNLAPATYANAAVVQLFYWNNWMHDQLYALGFTEAAGNFQTDNFGRGGLGEDAVQADAQDGGGVNNANFGTPPDGLAPRMQMYVFDGPNPPRDGDLDAEIILHEYTHGLSNRRVGGGVGIGALQSAGMGEGWSDFYGLTLLSEASDDLDGNYAAGAYASFNLAGLRENYYFGIRRYPYTTDLSKNPLTFKDIDPAQADPHAGVPRSPVFGAAYAAEVHAQGEVWCVTLWEVRAALIRKHGFAVGNTLVLQLVTDGMNFSPANPNFLEARDAILQADRVDTGGANYREIWGAFARRGMGYSASSPSSATTSGVEEAFDTPDDLTISPRAGLSVGGPAGGPFSPAVQAFVLMNLGTNSIPWGSATTAGWLDLGNTSGTLSPGSATVSVDVSLNTAAAFLPPGTHHGAVYFTNEVSGVVQARLVTLIVGQPDSLTAVITSAAAELGYQSILFTPDGSDSFYSVCRQPANHFPTDPRTGRLAQLSDDDFEAITLPGGATVSLFGRRTNVFFIGSNGYLTLQSGDQTLEPTLATHFNRPRVSALFADLNPFSYSGSQSAVYWQQLGDRVAVTWRGVSEYANYNTNNFQVEWFYDGRIRLTYLDLDVKQGLVGLSRGQGVPHDFSESDLGLSAVCGPQLRLTLPATVTEGGGLLAGQGQVAIPAPADQDLIISLTSSDPDEVNVPPVVFLEAGQTSVAFDLTVGEDADADGTQLVTVTASGTGYRPATAHVLVQDNEAGALALSLPATVSEGAGAVAGTVSVAVAVLNDLVLHLSSSRPEELQVPELVLIRAGTRTATFLMTLTDNVAFEEPRTVTVTAHVDHWPDGTATVQITDNEPRTLALRLPAQASEAAGVLRLAGSVGVVAPLPTNLVVALSSSDPSVLALPATVTISSGRTNQEFNLTMIDNAVLDGSRSVNVTARSAGWVEANASLTTLDDETPGAPTNPRPLDLSADVSLSTRLSWNFNGPGGELLVNGDFETGTLAGWQVESIGSGGFEINDGGVDPAGPEGTTAPWQGSYSALSEQTSVGTFTLWQEVAIPADQPVVTLRWADKIRNWSTFSDAQRFRVEIRGTNNALLAVAFTTKPGDTALAEWVERSYDLAAFRGQTIRLAFVQQNEPYYFNVHLDGISVRASGGAPTTYDVYFGTTSNLGPGQMVGQTTETAWTLPSLAPLTTYYWQVVARRLALASGPVWSFTTRGLDHFSWGPVAALQHAGVPFNATLTAKDELDRPLDAYTGTVGISLVPAADDQSFTMLGSASPSSTFNTGTFTIGYSFTPTNDLYVTAVRHYSGTKLSIWTDDGTLLLAQTVSDAGGAWRETVLPGALKLSAGTTYRVGFLSGGRPYFGRMDMNDDFPHGRLEQSYEIPGDAFPTRASSWRWIFVDLRYQLAPPAVLDLSPGSISGFVHGTWTGPITSTSLGTNVVLRARDEAGRLGLSTPFSLAPGAGVLDHFVWSTVPSPQGIGQLFAVSLTAKDALGGTVSDYHGIPSLHALVEPRRRTVGEGTGTANLPLGTFFQDGRAQVIYPSSALDGAQRLTGLALNVAVVPGQTLHRWTIRLRTTSLRGYDSPYPSWESSQWTTVFQQDVTLAATGWTTFLFSQPFEYDGVQNLMVDFSFLNDSYSFDGEVLATATEDVRALGFSSDGERGDPLNFAGSYPPPLLLHLVPNIQLLSPGTPIFISPGVAGAFSSGVWSGTLAVLTPAPKVQLVAEDPGGPSGYGNVFAVGAPNDVSVVMTATPAQVALGERVTYTITASNSGPLVATSTLLIDTIPLNQSFVSATVTQGSATLLGNTVRFNVGTLNAGDSVRATLVVAVTGSGTYSNTVSSSHTEPDGYGPNNTAAAFTFAAARLLQGEPASGYENDADASAALFRLHLSVPSTEPISIQFATADGTARAGMDYVATNGTLVLAPGQTERVIAVPILDDSIYEDTEHFSVNLVGPPGLSLAQSTLSGTIYDNDPTPSVSINDVSVVEGDTGFTNAVFTLTLSAPSGRSTSVTYTTEDQGATGGVDYAATTAVVSFSPGQTTQTIRVRVFGDTEAETNETFAVRLTNIQGGYPQKERGICTILADDPGPVIAPAATQIVSDPNHNHAIDPAERVTVQFGLYNAGPVGTANLVATLQSGQGVNAPDGPQTYGVLNPHGEPVSRAFSFTASGVNGGTIVATLHLQDGETDLGVVTFSFLLGPRSEFHIVSLSTNQCAAIEHVLVTGDDRGGIAASSSKVFCTGDDGTGRFSLDDLSGGASVGARYEALTSNLRTETAYVLGNGSVPLSSGGGLATSLLQLDEQTGALNGGRINLSAPIDLFYGAGLFAGYDRVVAHTGNHGYEISLPSGSVRDLGSLPSLNHTFCETWAYWGVVEHEGSTLYLVYVKDSQTIVRTRLPDGLTTVVGTFSYLGDMCSITVSLSRRRWYFHQEGYSQFRSGDETLGFCDASFSFGTVPVLDHFGWSAVARARLVGQAIPVTVTARDQFDDVYTNFNAPVTLSGTAAGGEAMHTLLDAPVPAYTNIGAYTMGYSFTPSTNLSVTHVRHISGTKVTIWSDDGRPLLVVPVISTPGVWLETPLSAPLQLQAGTRYRLGVYTGGDSGVAYYRYDLGNAFPDGSIDADYEGFGDTFPNLRGGPRWLVDLRYAVATDRPVSITPVASPNFVRGVWAGSVTVLEAGTNVVLHAADPSSHRGASTPFRVLAVSSGQLDHFEWAPIASPQTMDAPFPATITAMTDLDETLAGFSGTVALSGYGLSPGSYTLWGDGGPDSSLNNGNYTLGYAFTPTANLLVTHVRPFSGTKVSIWDNAGTLLVSVPVSAGPGHWSETPLSAPLLLEAGNTYRIGFLTGNATYYQGNTSPGAFANGTIEGSFYTAGDGFPDNPFATGWWLVDLRYQASAFTGLPLQPVTSANFVGGTWTGDLTVLQGATDVVLHADAGGGRVGESNPFTVRTVPAPRLAISRVGDAVVLSWPAEATRYALETAASLSHSSVWFPAGLAPVVTGDRRMVTNSLSGPGLFFRLNRQ